MELADVFNSLKDLKTTKENWQVVNAITKCRTSSLGGHLYQCNHCEKIQPRYNSCRNRHCPKCQGKETARWLEARSKELLNVPYFHLVFTLPDEFNEIVINNKELVLDVLFKAVSKTLLKVAERRLKGKIGFFSILHTWGQKLQFHPHLHCVVPGLVLFDDGTYKTTSKKFFLPIKILNKVFRAIFIKKLRVILEKNKLLSSDHDLLLRNSTRQEWIVYAQRPFAGPETVLKYLANYTHKIAISNSRIKKIEREQVFFSYKDYQQGGKKFITTLPVNEFARRFLLHVLPAQFVRIRHYGFLSAKNKKKILPSLKLALPAISRIKQVSDELKFRCQLCKNGKLIMILNIPIILNILSIPHSRQHSPPVHLAKTPPVQHQDGGTRL